MHSHGLTASEKAVCTSRPSNLLSITWGFWIVHECVYHVQAKDGFQPVLVHRWLVLQHIA